MARIDEIKAICEKNNLVLIEDACQAVGGTFNGRALGAFGHMGCFSFDAVKTITCGEGGAVITDDPTMYQTADAYADHGHDHVGNDRGLEGHPILGNNFRISELNAAVGLAQLRKLDDMLLIQRKYKNAIKEALKKVPGITFRHLPDERGDSATFLSFFLPDKEKTEKAVQLLGEAGVDGCFYWYANNWHYYRKWEHLGALKSPAKLPQVMMANMLDYQNLRLPVSDAIMEKMISMQIKLSWTDKDVDQRIEKMVNVLGQVV